MSDTYYVISISDGAYLEPMSKEELEVRLDSGYYGDRPFLKPTDSIDLMAREGLIIIRGTAIIPKPKQVVQTWDVTG